MAQQIRTYTASATRAGISFGSALAIAISWSLPDEGAGPEVLGSSS